MSQSQKSPNHLAEVAGHSKWSFHLPDPPLSGQERRDPRAVAASQFRYLQRDDLQALLRRRETSVDLRRCIEKLGETPHPARSLP